MDDKYKKLVDTLPKESEDLWFEYNLAVNKIIQENNQLKEQKKELRELLTKYLCTEEYCGEVGTVTTQFVEDLGNVLNELEGKNE